MNASCAICLVTNQFTRRSRFISFNDACTLSHAGLQRATVWSHVFKLVKVAVGIRSGGAQSWREDDLFDERVDDLVGALILLKLDLGLGRLEELHGAMGNNINPSVPMPSTGGNDGRSPSRPMGSGGCSVVGLDLNRAQGRQLFTDRAGVMLW